MGARIVSRYSTYAAVAARSSSIRRRHSAQDFRCGEFMPSASCSSVRWAEARSNIANSLQSRHRTPQELTHGRRADADGLRDFAIAQSLYAQMQAVPLLRRETAD